MALQAKAISLNPGQNGFAAAFTSPMTITGSARIYSIFTSQEVFNGQVIVKISTDGKFLIVGKLNFAANQVSISGRLYADLSKVSSGNVVVLFLADVPDQIRLLTVYGKLKMGFKNASGDEVTFDVLDAAPAGTPTAAKPTVTLVDPVAPGGSVDVNAIAGRTSLDVVFSPPAGSTLDYAKILDDADEFTLTVAGTPITRPTGSGRPTPVVAITTAGGVALEQLVVDTIGGKRVAVQRAFGAPAGTGVVIATIDDLVDPPAAGQALDDALLIAAIKTTGTNRFRYAVGTVTWAKGEVELSFGVGDVRERAPSRAPTGPRSPGPRTRSPRSSSSSRAPPPG